MFVRSGTAWNQQAELTAADGLRDDFGNSVAISGSTAVVGADLSRADFGAAYVFVRTGAAGPAGRADRLRRQRGRRFGDSVAISGSTPWSGAVGKDSFAGAVYVFKNA